MSNQKEFKWPDVKNTPGVVVKMVVDGVPTLHYFREGLPPPDVVEATRRSLEDMRILTARSQDFRKHPNRVRHI
jgi:hypothetical protein